MLLELVEVHEPLLVVVVVPVVAWPLALWANIALDIITNRSESKVLFSAPPLPVAARVRITLSETAYFAAHQGWVTSW